MTHLLSAYVHGLVIDAQGGKGGVVHLVIRADQKNTSAWGRLRQHMAHALFRAGDFCHPSYDKRAVRVVSRPVGRQPVDDVLPHLTHSHVVELAPLYLADGEAHYNALFVHESVKHHEDGRSNNRTVGAGRQEGADDSHGGLFPLSDSALKALNVVILPDAGNATQLANVVPA